MTMGIFKCSLVDGQSTQGVDCQPGRNDMLLSIGRRGPELKTCACIPERPPNTTAGLICVQDV